jgi:hypothetical protein
MQVIQIKRNTVSLKAVLDRGAAPRSGEKPIFRLVYVILSSSSLEGGGCPFL